MPQLSAYEHFQLTNYGNILSIDGYTKKDLPEDYREEEQERMEAWFEAQAMYQMMDSE